MSSEEREREFYVCDPLHLFSYGIYSLFLSFEMFFNILYLVLVLDCFTFLWVLNDSEVPLVSTLGEGDL